jgi:serine/threonine protein kinase
VQTLSELAPGTLFGRYRIDRLRGRDGMGSVYAAEQLDDGRTVALKVLATTLDTAEDRALSP